MAPAHRGDTVVQNIFDVHLWKEQTRYWLYMEILLSTLSSLAALGRREARGLVHVLYPSSTGFSIMRKITAAFHYGNMTHSGITLLLSFYVWEHSKEGLFLSYFSICRHYFSL